MFVAITRQIMVWYRIQLQYPSSKATSYTPTPFTSPTCLLSLAHTERLDNSIFSCSHCLIQGLNVALEKLEVVTQHPDTVLTLLPCVALSYRVIGQPLCGINAWGDELLFTLKQWGMNGIAC